MHYEIHQLVSPTQLQRKEMYGNSVVTSPRLVLEPLQLVGIVRNHLTIESAIEEITKNKAFLKDMNLTIVPVISVDQNGEIRY